MTNQVQISPTRGVNRPFQNQNHPVKKNNNAFGLLMLFFQVAISAIYGTVIQIQAVNINIVSIISMILLAILIVAGFGLTFGYTKRLLWSGIGFTLLITAITIELYPLINAFWIKVGLHHNQPSTNFRTDSKLFYIFLSDRESALVTLQRSFYGNSMINALKCGLSLSIAFSSILGRAGQLEALLVAWFGTVTFELNRQLIQQKRGIDAFGTYYIFTFGGFMGLGLGFLLFLRERRSQNTYSRQSMSRYTGSQTSVMYAGLGTLIIFSLFPILAFQPDGMTHFNQYSPYTNPLCIIAGLGSGAVGALFVSALVNGTIIVRDLFHGVIAGAIVVGASSLYISNPIYAIVAGTSGGAIQALIQNFIERTAAREKKVVSTVSWSLFGIQGIIGAGFAAGWKAILYNSKNGLPVESRILDIFNPQFELYGGLISAGIGLGSGLLVGLLVLLLNKHGENDFFEDNVYWMNTDYLNKLVRQENVKPFDHPKPIASNQSDYSERKDQKPVQPDQIPYRPDQTYQADYQFDFSEATHKEINQYAYL